MLLSASPASPLHARTSGQLISPQMLQALRTAAFGDTWRESEGVDMELAEIVRKRNLEKEIASKSYIAKDIPLTDGGVLLPPPTPSELLLRYANRVNNAVMPLCRRALKSAASWCKHYCSSSAGHLTFLPPPSPLHTPRSIRRPRPASSKTSRPSPPSTVRRSPPHARQVFHKCTENSSCHGIKQTIF